MLTLYQRSPGGILYWEAWETDHELIVHHGTLGDTGQMRRLEKSRSSREHVDAEMAQRRSEGYSEIAAEDHVTVVLQYRTDGWGSEEDLRRREAVTHLLDECLGGTGLGRCDGRDLGGGTMNFFCSVVDPRLAVDVMVRELKKSHYLRGAIIAIEVGDEVSVRWPPDFHRPFSY